jgi:aromatase/bifunctional cyclase/aromatase
MTDNGRQHTTHQIDIDADPALVYDLVGRAAAWPQHFAPTIHVEQSDLGGSRERLHIWATASGEVKSWSSQRTLDSAARIVAFRQEVSSPPVASMGGRWIVQDGPAGGTRLVLEHDFTAIDDDAESIAWITGATDRNSGVELANLKELAEHWHRIDELVFSFADSLRIEADPETVYEFLYDAARWGERLPHVASIDLTEDVPNVQSMVMDTRAKDGSVHTTESVRICFPTERIVYKQLRTPSMMTAHTGEWLIEKDGTGVTVTSKHTVTLNEPAIRTVLGVTGTVESAKEFIHNAAGGNSRATLALAKQFSEACDA